MERKGIDVSKHQGGNIDWRRVKADGVEFFILRGFIGSKATPPACGLDEQFRRNLAGCKAAGIPIGIYWISYEMNIRNAEDCATWLVAELPKLGLTPADVPYGIWWDIEGEGGNDFYDQWPLGRETISGMAEAFCGTLTRAGWPCGVYCNDNWRRNRLTDTVKARYPLWVAKYSQTPPDCKCAIWQHSSTGRVDGIVGNVDLNICYRLPGDTKPVATPPAAAKPNHPMLRTGSRGSAVLELQRLLEAVGLPCGAHDGIFGPGRWWRSRHSRVRTGWLRTASPGHRPGRRWTKRGGRTKMQITFGLEAVIGILTLGGLVAGGIVSLF